MDAGNRHSLLDSLTGWMRASLPWQLSATLLARAIGNLQKRNFVVLSSARCGSNLLVDYINTHWRIVCHREILNHRYVVYGQTSDMPCWRKRLHIKSFFLKAPRPFIRMPRQFVGFKALHDQFDRYGIELSTIIHDLAIRRLIILYREDLLETFVSLKIAEANDLWYSNDHVNAISTEINELEFLAYCREHRQLWTTCTKQIPPDCATLFLSYESLVQDPANELHRVFKFLGPRYNRCPTAKSVRQNPAPIKEKITNYESLPVQDSTFADLRFFDLPQFLENVGSGGVGRCHRSMQLD